MPYIDPTKAIEKKFVRPRSGKKAEIARLTAQEVSVSVVLKQLAALISCDVGDFVDRRGYLLPLHDMKPEARAAIEGLTFARRGIYWQVSGVVIGKRGKAIELAMRYLGMLGSDADRSREALSLRKLIEEARSLPEVPAYLKAGEGGRG
jgi:hypothetical protein